MSIIEESPIVSMARTTKIIRKSIHTFLQNYHYLTSIATFIALPFSITLLISQAIIPRSLTLLPTIYTRLNSLLDAAGFLQSSSVLFSLVSHKLSQTISTWVLTIPFALSFLLLAKASIIPLFTNTTAKNLSFSKIYTVLLSTHLCNSLLIFAANATCFSIFFLALNFLQDFQVNSTYWMFFLTGVFAVFYSIVIANTLIVCNLALISSALETHKTPGFLSILRACITIKGKTSTALALAVPINLGLAAIEALFYYRIIKPHQNFVQTDTHLWFIALEGVLIAYLYSILLVLEVIITCFFYKTCIKDLQMEIQELCYYNNVDFEKMKDLDDFV